MRLRRFRSIRRGVQLAAVSAVAFGIVSASIPAVAMPLHAAVADTPAPTDSATPSNPTPSNPTPGNPSPSIPSPSEPAPGDATTPGSPIPSTPPPTPPTPLPTGPEVAPATPGSGQVNELPFVSGAPAAPLTPSNAVPAALGRVFPTNPWIYNAQPGTRYLDERDRTGNDVTRRHLGIDAQGDERQPIFAVADGTVTDGTWGTTSRDRHGYGNYVEISHSDGYATRYAHFADAPVVKVGDRVIAGQLIGYMGGSQRGNLTALARHLHFEVTLDGRNVDPLAFLGEATTTVDAAPAVVIGSQQLYEIRPGATEGYVSSPTGLFVDSNVFTAIDMGDTSAQVFVSEGGTLKQLAVQNGAWTESDTGVALNATSISGANTGRGFAELFAVEDGKLFHIVRDAAGWTKTWTGHYFSGTVSAVRMPGDQLHGMLQQAGYLYHLYPAEGGLWNVSDTRVRVGKQIDAVYVAGRAPEVMTVIDGQVQRVVRGEVAWGAVSTRLPAAGSLAAVSQGAGWPVALTATSDALGMTTVVGGMWTRYSYALTIAGPIDAVAIAGVGPVLYSIG